MSVGMVVGGVAQRGVANPQDAVLVLTLACLAGSVLVGLRGLFMVVSLLLLRFGGCMVVLAASWSASSSSGLFCCCQRCRVLGSVGSFV